MDLSVVISMLMKLPQAQMTAIKKDFGRTGLDLESFVWTIMRHLSKSRQGNRSKEEIQQEGIDAICDLTDFFNQVTSLLGLEPPYLPSTYRRWKNINKGIFPIGCFQLGQVDVDGKKIIGWEEFLGYIVEQSAALKRDKQFQDTYALRPDYDLLCNGHKETIHQIHWVLCHGRLFACMGQKIKIFDVHTRDAPKNRLTCELELSARGSLDYVGAFDLCYIEEDDLLVVLQMNLCMSFFKFLARGVVTPDYIRRVGDVVLSHQPYRVQWSTGHRLLLTAGNDNTIKAWKLKMVDGANYKILHHHSLKEHKDVVTDMLIVHDRDGFELLVTAGMDRRVVFWDLNNFRAIKDLSGHKAGITCLAYDGESQVFSAGFDCEIFVWDVNGNSHSPSYKLGDNHKFPIVRLAVAMDQGRMVSLDRQGKFCWWDIRKAVALDNKERCIQALISKEHCHTIEVVRSPPGMKKKWSLNGLSIVTACDRIHIYDCIDARPTDMPPSLVVFNWESVTVLTTHGSDMKVWDATAGKFLKDYPKLTQGDITGLEFDKGRRKMFVSSQGGEIILCNYFNGQILRRFPQQRAEVLTMIYLEQDHLILIGTADRAIRVLDELAVNNSDCILRSVEAAHQSDMTSMVYDPDLLLMATASADESIKLWDFQFFTLEGIYYSKPPLGGEISCIAFYPSYPLLLVGDTSGGFSLVPVRSWQHAEFPRYSPILRVTCLGGSVPVLIREQHDEGTAIAELGVAVVLMAVGDVVIPSPAPSTNNTSGNNEELHEPPSPCEPNRRKLVYICNEVGVVRAYDIQPLLDALGIKPSLDIDNHTKKNNYNPRRKISRNGCTMRVAGTREAPDMEGRGRGSFVDAGQERPSPGNCPNPLLSLELKDHIKLVYSWVAHDDRILAIEILSDPSTIFTSSADLSVKLWSPTGMLLGVLTWGRQLDVSLKRCWNFPFDFEARQNSRKSKAKDLLDNVMTMKTSRRKSGRPESPSLLPALTETSTSPLCIPSQPTAEPDQPPSTSTSPVPVDEAIKSPLWIEGGYDAVVVGGYDEGQSLGLEKTEGEEPLPIKLEALQGIDRGGGLNPAKVQHDVEVGRILGQLRGEMTWVRPEMEVVREQTIKRLKEQQRRESGHMNKMMRKKKKKRRRGFLGEDEKDNVYRSIQAVDKVVDRLKAEESKQAERRKQAEEEEALGAASRRRSTALLDEGQFEMLKCQYEGRHKTMYPNLHMEHENMEAQSDLHKAVMALRSLSPLTSALLTTETPSSPTAAPHQQSHKKRPPPPRPLKVFPSQAELAAANKEADDEVKRGKQEMQRKEREKRALLASLAKPPQVDPEKIQALTRPTQASVLMQSPIKYKREADAVNKTNSYKYLQKRVRAKRRIGPYPREDLLNYYDAFHLADHRKTGKASLKDLLGTEFVEVHGEYRSPLERSFFGTENGETRVMTLEEGLRVAFPLLHAADRKEVMVLFDMYQAHLDRQRPKTRLKFDQAKLEQLKTLFELYDSNGSETVDMREIMEGIRNADDKLGIGPILETFMQEASQRADTILKFDEFVALAGEMELL